MILLTERQLYPELASEDREMTDRYVLPFVDAVTGGEFASRTGAAVANRAIAVQSAAADLIVAYKTAISNRYSPLFLLKRAAWHH